MGRDGQSISDRPRGGYDETDLRKRLGEPFAKNRVVIEDKTCAVVDKVERTTLLFDRVNAGSISLG